MTMIGLYDRKPDGYFVHCRADLLELLPLRKNRILEVGCGCGDTLLKAKELGLAESVVGIELVSVAESNQTHPELDRFIAGDIETIALDFEDDYFDVILCGDVLEHLNDPWKTVHKLTRYLKPGGVCIASIPNIREVHVLLNLIMSGDFRYTDAGIMDRTHLRFFCRKNFRELFEQCGLRVISIGSDLDRLKKGKRVIFDRLTLKLFHDFLVTQFYITGRKETGLSRVRGDQS